MEFLKGIGGLYFLAGALTTTIAFEQLAPWRRARTDFARWLRNFSMYAYGSIVLGLAPVLATYGAALKAQEANIGLMNILAAPYIVTLIATIFIFDLLTYSQHRALHKWYFLWRTHRAHHSDRALDATTSLRFHPFETLFRAAIDVGVVVTLGIPPDGVLLVFMIYAVMNSFGHANIKLPAVIEKYMPLVFTTPSVHRLHHSTDVTRQYSNFGTVFTIWDRLLGTYLAPVNLRKDEVFGLDGPEAMPGETFGNLALDPFRKPADGAAIPKPSSDIVEQT